MLLRLRPESNELIMVEVLSSQWRFARCTYDGECKYYVMCVILTDKTWHHSGASFQGCRSSYSDGAQLESSEGWHEPQGDCPSPSNLVHSQKHIRISKLIASASIEDVKEKVSITRSRLYYESDGEVILPLCSTGATRNVPRPPARFAGGATFSS